MSSLHRPAPKAWWPDWTGETVVIAASGPSQNKADLDYVRGKARVVAINRTWELCPWADVLYSAAQNFWPTYRPGFAGLRIAGGEPCEGCEFEPARDWLPEEDERLSNSGAQAIVLAECWGAARIVLTGFDMKGRHWHPDHSNGNPFTRFPDFIAGLGILAEEIRVPVINCSRDTAVASFPRARIEDVV